MEAVNRSKAISPSEYKDMIPYMEVANILLEGDNTVTENNRAYKLKEALNIITEESSPVAKKLTERLYQSILDKAHIDFDDIPKSQGNIHNYSGYSRMCDSLAAIRELAERDKNKEVLVYVTIVEDAIKNIADLSATYNRGFTEKKAYVALEYDTYVYTCVQATSALIYSYVDFMKDPSSDIFNVKIMNTKLRADKFYFDQLSKFNNIIKKDGIQYRKMLEEMLNKGRNNFIGVDDMVVGIAALAAVAYAAIPITRALIYQIYKLRTKLSDTLELQSKFLELNETCVLNNSTLDKDKKKEIVEKQKKLAKDLKKLSDSIRVKSAKSIVDSEKEIKKDNSSLSINTIRDDISNSAFELI